MSSLEIHLFGYPRILRDGQALKLERRRTLALLAYLALSGPCARDSLTAFFWPDYESEQAGAYLRHALWEIAKILGDECLDREGALLSLRFEHEQSISLWCDARELDALQERVRQGDMVACGRVAALHQEDFLKGFTLKDSYEFDDWQAARQEAYRLQLSQALDALASAESSAGRVEEALAYARRRLALDALDEAAHRQVMLILDRSGQRAAALRQYETCQRILHEQLGVAPEAETARLHQRILSSQTDGGSRPERQPSRPAVFTRPPIPVYLPIQPMPFVGRRAEQEQILTTLSQPDCRLLVLIGPGGSGKTRLAIQAAGSFASTAAIPPFPDGIYFCDLSAVADPQQVPDRLAESLRLQLQRSSLNALPPDQVLEQVRLALADKTILLVLDHLEQLADSADLFLDLLTAAPGLKFLATSRERLNLPGEWVLELPGLPIPGSQEDILSNPAVELFLRGAQRAGRFQPSPLDFPAIIEICRQVDGMPLGIELASSWVRMFTCAEIAVEIARGMDILDTAAGSRSGPRSAFEHSWRLLPQAMQEIFTRLAIFHNGFTRDAAQSVAGASLRHLAALSDRSLIRRVASGRYDLHELLKQYASEKLAQRPESKAETRDRHAAYYLDWISREGEQLKGSGQLAAIAGFHLELPNIRTAWRRGIELEDILSLGRAIPNLILFHDMQGIKLDGFQMLDELMTLLRRRPAQPEETATRAIALAARRHLSLGTYPLSAYEPDQLESLRLSRLLPDGVEKAYALLLNGLGPAAPRGRESLDLCLESRAIFERIGDRWGQALATLITADTSLFGGVDDDLSMRFYTQCIQDFKAMGDEWGMMLANNGLAYFAIKAGRLDDAAARLEQSLAWFSAFGDASRMIDLRYALSDVCRRSGQKERALEYLRANQDFLLQAGQKKMAERAAAAIRDLESAAVP